MLLRYIGYLLAVLAFIPFVSWLAAGEGPEGGVIVHAAEAGSGRPLPCRLTIVDSEGELAPVTAAKDPWIASRPGVVYTGTGRARFTLPQGRYTLHANRGLEYGLVTRRLEIGARETTLRLELEREVDTTGYIAADTHIHTLTHSGHGDATIQERMATIAGEGIELAVATDHNHHTDYRPAARAAHAHEHFTPVIGNEVTTKAGHFNAFPIRPGSRVPDATLTDWVPLLREIRETPGVRVVVLNHPSNDHSGFIPTHPRRFHPASGEAHDRAPWSFDGIEVVTSAALQSDLMKPYRDWFALLNRGSRAVGIGSSDTHDVDRFILGQARTYVAASASRPDQIDVREVCDNILAGRVLASMGLLTEAWVNGRYSPGDLAPAGKGPLRVRVRVRGPRWISADRLELYANGQKVAERPIKHPARAVVKADLTLELPRPARDLWFVAVATGPGVREPYWPTARPYQPIRADWDPRVVGSTSPIRIDADGDGRYSSPLDYARPLVAAYRAAPQELVAALRPYDEAVAVQAASLLRQHGEDLTSPPLRRAADAAAPHVRHGFVAYRNLLPQE